ncbi:hypothetical protein GC209_09870 [bacterium]|nr:hypothetical protein [bacterium]
MPKTGSTSVQETFAQNPAALAKAGHFYAKIRWPNGQVHSNHSFPMIVAFSEGWEGRQELVRRGLSPVGLKDHFTDQISQALSQDGGLILSGENIAEIPDAGLARFLDLVRGAGRSLAPVIFVRPPLEFLISMTQTTVRHGQPFEVRKLGARDKLQRCLRLWPQITCVPFGAGIADRPSPPEVLIKAFGLGEIADFRVIRSNDSMSDLATRLIGYVNAQLPLFVSGAVNPLRQHLDTDPLIGIRGPKFRLTREEFAGVREFITQENRVLSSLLGVAYCDAAFDLAESRPVWTAEALVDLRCAMGQLSDPLNDCIRAYFRQPASVTPAERDLAGDVLG